MTAASNKKSSGFGVYKAPLIKRYFAGLLDVIVPAIFIIGALLAFDSMWMRVLGAAIGLLYILLKDFLFVKSLTPSPGKKAVGMRVEPSRGQRESINIVETILRNIPIAVGPMIMVIPKNHPYIPTLGLMFWGFSLLVEGLIIFRDPEGKRLGDQMAGTKVFD
ncbi:RDD family protein [Acidobacteriota bacterium]